MTGWKSSSVGVLRSVVGRPEVVAGLAGLFWLIVWAGRKVLNPTRIDWLLSGGDWSQHLMGWLFLRNESWKLPLGRLDGLVYPLGTTIGYTDSTPWVSLLLRPFSSILPVDFQFIGPWLAMCFFLQGAAGAWLAGAFTRDHVAKFCSGVLFATSPVLLFRVVHESLCAHWMIVILLGLHVRSAPDFVIAKRHLLIAFGLTVLSVLTHPYLAMMVMGLALALIVKLVLVDRALDWSRAVIVSTVFPSVALLAFWLLGYFSGGVSIRGPGFNNLNSNMLALLDASGASRFLNPLPFTNQQWEGYGYLGLGNIAVIMFALISLVLPATDRQLLSIQRVWPAALVSLGFAFYALGPSPKLGSITLLHLEGFYSKLEFFTSPFRSSGRFFWVLHYGVIAAGVVVVVCAWKRRPRVAAAALAMACALQVLDVKYSLERQAPFGWTRIEAGLNSPLWNKVGTEYRHLALVPPQIATNSYSCTGDFGAELRWPFAYVAYVQKMTFNSGYLARVNTDALIATCHAINESVRRGELDVSTLYVVGTETLTALGSSHSTAVCGRVDSYNVCVSAQSTGETRRFLETHAIKF